MTKISIVFMEVMMKRFWAAVIDYFLCCIFCAVIFYLSWKILRTKIVWKYYFRGVYHLVTYIVYFVYSVIFDSLCQGITPGKEFMDYKLSISEDEITVGWIIKHALCKTIAMKVSIPSAVYYISKTKMPYDKLLGIGFSNKNTEIIEQRKINDIKLRKRLGSIIIDHLVMSFLIVIPGLLGIQAIRSFYQNNYIVYCIIFLSFLMVFFMFSYFFISDFLTKGSGIGKRIVGIRLMSNGQKLDGIVIWKHCGLKFVACCVWPVSFIYLLVTGRMFYDKWLKLEIVAEGEEA